MPALPYRLEAGALFLFIRLTPRAARDALENARIDAEGKAYLGARVRAVPENGKANEALIALLARELDVKKSAISIISGASARQKTLKILSDATPVHARLALLVSGEPLPDSGSALE
ncbi:MAG: DUF167 family protein [Proteobacteria bacterium]|nr:DUF167 family protein [Pseudomonadota bacterium]